MNDFTVWRAFALATQFSITLGVFVGLGVFAGTQLDTHFHSPPLFTLICIFLGLGLGSWSGVQLIQLALQRSGKRK
ncbi:MAG: AtpZ/AtpI family protein [Chloroflexi bacterium]|nr:AtpZ/AtpI family protein [Chloroflexota bacterium]